MTDVTDQISNLADRIAAVGDHLGERICADAFFVSRWVELGLLALLYTGLLVAVMRITRLTGPVRACANRIAACAYEILLFRHNVRAVVVAEFRLLGWNLRCMLCLLPVAAMGLAMFHMISGTLANRYAYRPVTVDEPVVIQVSGPDAAAMNAAGSAAGVEIDAIVYNKLHNTAWVQVCGKEPGLLAIGPPASPGAPRLNVNRPAHPAQRLRRPEDSLYRVCYPLAPWWGDRHGWMWAFGVLCLLWTWPLTKVFQPPHRNQGRQA